MSDPINDPEVARLEAALIGLAPAPAQIDRDALLFRAGRDSASRGRFWPCTAALFAVVAGGLVVTLAVRPAPQIAERVVYVVVPQPAPDAQAIIAPPALSVAQSESVVPSSERARLSAAALQQWVLRWGVEGLPVPVRGTPVSTTPEKPSPPTSLGSYRVQMALNLGGRL
ncbi:MAG TPA: hypothetical protein VEL76_17225 [Gemmataceae bacterium]|nr:hypothetical protein [Gemmataceae bacterium]